MWLGSETHKHPTLEGERSPQRGAPGARGTEADARAVSLACNRHLAFNPQVHALLPCAVAVLLAVGCIRAPHAPPLAGTPSPVRLPQTDLPPGHRSVTFRWTYSDPDVRMRGDGVARIAAPDSARIDFFLDGGLGSGRAILIGDRVRVPGMGIMARFLPPPPLLWATLGRLSVPPSTDTLVRLDGETLRADIGRSPIWRSAFAQGELRRLERIDDDRLKEWVVRDSTGGARYQQPVARRTLGITVIRTDTTAAFDASIFR